MDSSAVEQLFQHAVFRYTINLTYTGDDDVEEDAVKQHLIAKVTLAVSAEPVDGELEDPRIHLLDKYEYCYFFCNVSWLTVQIKIQEIFAYRCRLRFE